MLCPICKEPLQTAERHGVEIDFCVKCRGVWLDRGELDKIIVRAAQFHALNAHDGDFPQYDASSGQHLAHRYPAKKNSSYLEELFDFDD
jgi:Zn-finger nucleic acid-binding protein